MASLLIDYVQVHETYSILERVCRSLSIPPSTVEAPDQEGLCLLPLLILLPTIRNRFKRRVFRMLLQMLM